jgi:hypothetical protein
MQQVEDTIKVVYKIFGSDDPETIVSDSPLKSFWFLS